MGGGKRDKCGYEVGGGVGEDILVFGLREIAWLWYLF